MGKVLQFPRRVIGAALTLAGAAIVFVLFVPIASGDNVSGRGQITGYSNKKVGMDQQFYVFGKNLNHVIDSVDGVWCWSQVDNAWLPVSNWDYVTSKAIWVDANNDCVGNHSAIGVEFLDSFVVGPRLSIV